MESPVIIESPSLRGWAAWFLAYWSDEQIQTEEWLPAVPNPNRGMSLYGQLGFMYDDFDLLPTMERPPGFILSGDAERTRFLELGVPLDSMIRLPDVDIDHAETFLDHPLWQEVRIRSAVCLTRLVLDGGCWDHQDPAYGRHSLPGHRVRAQLLQGMASLVELDTFRDRGEDQPPLWRPYESAVETIRDAVDHIARSGAPANFIVDGRHEQERLDLLVAGIDRDGPGPVTTSCARDAFCSVVLNGGGWNHLDHPSENPS